jgi:hypothetical protein
MAALSTYLLKNAGADDIAQSLEEMMLNLGRDQAFWDRARIFKETRDPATNKLRPSVADQVRRMMQKARKVRAKEKAKAVAAGLGATPIKNDAAYQATRLRALKHFKSGYKSFVPYESIPGYKEWKDVKNVRNAVPLVALAGIGLGGLGLAYNKYWKKRQALGDPQVHSLYSQQELASDTAPDAQIFGTEDMDKQSASLPDKLMTSGMLVGASLPFAYAISRFHKDDQAAKRLTRLERSVRDSKKRYDNIFRQQVLEDMGLTEDDLKAKLQDMSKTSSLVDDIVKNRNLISTALVGTGLSMNAFQKGISDAHKASQPRADLQKYRELMNRLNRGRSSAVQLVDVAFSPEEMVALQSLSTHQKAPTKKPRMHPAKVPSPVISADTDNPELQELLASL